MGLSFITPIAYDFRFATSAIKSYYHIADEIILGVDQDFLSWSKIPYPSIDKQIGLFLECHDPEKKINVIYGDFHSYPTPLENDTAERTQLSLYCRNWDNWVVQIDSDEILMNPDVFKAWIERVKPNGLCIYARLINVFKVFGPRDALVVDPPTEWAAVATRLHGEYERCRQTKQDCVMSPLNLLHYSWGRRPEELLQKLQNWGHSDNRDWQEYLDFWQSVTLENYEDVKDFHPLTKGKWKKLNHIYLEQK